MTKDNSDLEYLNETHRAICRLFDSKFKQDWLDHNIACERWFDDGFKVDLTTFTLDIFHYKDTIGFMTKTEFEENYRGLENALIKVKRQLGSNSTQDIIASFNSGEYDFQKEKISYACYLDAPERHFTSLFKADLEKMLRNIRICRFSIANNVWTKDANTKPPKSLERAIVFKLLETFHYQFEKLPLAAGSKIEPNSKLIETANDIFSLRNLSKDARAACRDALNYYQSLSLII